MNKNSIFKTVLFCFGLVIILLAAIFVKPDYLPETWKYILIWIDVIAIYVAFLVPALGSGIKTERADRVFIGGAIYYIGAVIFAAALMAILALVYMTDFKHELLMILELAALLVFLVYVFLACFTKSHIDNVEYQEKNKRAAVDWLRNKSMEISAKTTALDSRFSDVKRMAEKTAQDMRYISPSSDKRAMELEDQMADILEQISQSLGYGQSTYVSSEQLLGMFQQVSFLFEQRKRIY